MLPFSYGTTNLWHYSWPCRKSRVSPSNKRRKVGWQAELQTRGIRTIPETAPNVASIARPRGGTLSKRAHSLVGWRSIFKFLAVKVAITCHHLTSGNDPTNIQEVDRTRLRTVQARKIPPVQVVYLGLVGHESQNWKSGSRIVRPRLPQLYSPNISEMLVGSPEIHQLGKVIAAYLGYGL